MKTIRFDNRRAMPRSIRIGVEMDNNVEQVKFELPELASGQTETLYWRNGGHADAVPLQDGVWTITDAVTRHPGEAVCYIAISDGGSTLWHSETFSVYVFDLPGTERLLDNTCPTAIQKAIDLAAAANERLSSAEEAVRAAGLDLIKGAYVGRDVSLNGRVYQTLRPPHFELWFLGHALMAENGQVVVQEAENWDMYRYAFGQRMVLRVDELLKNSAIQGVLPMAYELESYYYPLDLNEVGTYITADALLVNCMKTTRSIISGGGEGETATLRPADFELWYQGHALMAEGGALVVQAAENWDMYRCALPGRTTLRVDSLAKNSAIQGVLPMAYEVDSTYYPLDLNEVNTTIEADALLVNCLNTAEQSGGVEGTPVTLTPAQFTQWYVGHALMAENGEIAVVAAENWDMYRCALPGRTMLRVDELVRNSAVQGVYPMAYELESTYYPLDLNEVNTTIEADALLVNYLKTMEQFSATGISYTPVENAGGSQGMMHAFSIASVSYTPLLNPRVTTLTTREYAIDHISFTADERRDFGNAVVCQDKLGEFDSIVCFGDSIFYGRIQQNGGQVTEQGCGVMQQFAGLMNLPLTNLAVSGATLSAMQASPKNVVQQVMDWIPEAGRTPMVILDGGTNDQAMYHLLNLGQYGDEDASTVYGAIKAIINMLLVKGIEPWQIVICTPIPKGIQGNAAYAAAIDAQLTAVGYAMYQTGIAMHCSVINGYGSVFGNLDSIYAKRIMMEDDTHPTEVGAMFYAHYLYDALCGRLGRLDKAVASLSNRTDSLETNASALSGQIDDMGDTLAHKADATGFYETLGAGTAEQLVSTVYDTDKAPYNFRTSGGSADIGNRMTDMLVGGTIAWNQLVDSATETVTLPAGHKYIACISGDWTCDVSDGTPIPVTGGTDMLFNLTLMLGSVIADYVYTLDAGTLGAGVAWFRTLFPKPYYAYNAGELMSVNAASHDTVGFNQWDEQWESGKYDSETGAKTADVTTIRSKGYIPVVGGATYYIKTPEGSRVLYYDQSLNYLGSQVRQDQTFTTPDDCRFIAFHVSTMTSYHDDICINLSWSGYRDGEYEPYVKRSYPLDHTLTLRGVPKLDAGNSLYYDGDTYAGDGKVTRKYGIVDMGTLPWATPSSVAGRFYSEGVASLIKRFTGGNVLADVVCAKYETIGYSDAWNQVKTGLAVHATSGALCVSDASLSEYDGNQFKSAMSGVYLVYALEEPTAETAEPYSNPQIVDDFGTEAYADYAESQSTRDVAVPVGHETQYMANLRDKLQHLPNLAAADGKYIISQSGTQMALTLLPPAAAELPDAPTTDGTYVLTATVADGEVTYTWESAT